MKIDLDQFQSHKVIENLSATEKLKFLSDNIVFLNDFDFRQNFSGLINKEKVFNWLLTNRDFRLEGPYGLATHTMP